MPGTEFHYVHLVVIIKVIKLATCARDCYFCPVLLIFIASSLEL